MSSLVASLSVTAGALDAFSQSLETIQNNIANAQTPGYAAQTQTLEALTFDPSAGTLGGVAAGAVESSRNEYDEQALRNQTVLLGSANQNVNSLTELQSLFDISGTSGIATSLNTLFAGFSAWAQSPNDASAQQNVITNASNLAQAFQQTATGLSQFTQSTNQQLQQTVSTINQLAGQLQADNQQIQQGNANDPALDASVHATLDQLAQYVNFTAAKQSDGTYTVLAGGQTPLVIGAQQYDLTFQLSQPTNPPPTNATGPPSAQILASGGADVTSQIDSGQLGALLNVRNTILPTYIGDSYQAGDINTMAQQFADSVNQQLTSGNISDGPPAQTGVALFTYDTSNPSNVAQTLAVNPSITPDQLAAIQPGPPEVANGVALGLAQMSNPLNASQEINGESYSDYYGDMASGIGAALDTATGQQTLQQSAVAQAQNLVQQASGVNLDQEAVNLVEFQRAYDANSHFVTVLDQITSDIILMAPVTDT
jgi:flagellar hook-associated protein 1 FlgK